MRRVKKHAFLLILLLLGLALPGALLQAAAVDVAIRNFTFDPQVVTVKVGDTVTWTNQISTLHTTTSGVGCSPDGQWNSGLMSQGQSFSHVFTTAGTNPYYCIPHCGIGMTGTVQVDEVTGAGDVPVSASLKQNYPNPFSPSTTIDYAVSSGTRVEISIFDVKGRLVRQLVQSEIPEGGYSVAWDGKDYRGNAQASGIYLYKMVAGGEVVDVKKMILLR